ncbi:MULTISPECIES: hypothetical protein [Nocardiaceae]|uniref:hypothetical protein n=1 Tax=Nocardiaceae TaxID=85025 RepID=UPI00055CD3EA|nr:MULTISPECIES: hypothetical protein [Rhodococcus]OZD12047.1 hypothetical protein CH248_29020 [Rhodococcus sp. 06-156-4a]OZD15812.1 hypothetical protein CH253_22900 [Rhodococcus sp. 06-156-3C]OZD21195.1 hypothetical protein CH280_03130 [Rhodococcus sp. 06-156-4C]OZD32378.1 hypothetical protein CH284_21065 [Rhodococcus sp. 06-156-3]OZD36600.1 hypothetical protein CH247_03485 [Rhodococcus sp. 06-156-3b]
MNALAMTVDAVAAAHSSSPDGTPDIPPVGPLPLRSVLGLVRVLMFVVAAGAAVAVVVFAVRTATFAGIWNESITAGPAAKLIKAIAFLILTSSMIEVLGWLRGELS